ncbi:MAG: DVUA0089 family protein [Bacteroidales bacterium]|nr:DVUA0089 family protein [Bacteroidales bacterium]
MKSKIYTRALMVMIVMLISSFSFAADWYVGPGGVDVNDGTNGTAALTPFATISFAITTAGADDVIIVAAGTYNEAITISKSLTLKGAKFDVDARTRDEADESILNYNGGLAINADGVTIDGFTIKDQSVVNWGAGWGYAVLMVPGHTGTQLLNNIIRNNIVGCNLANTGGSQVKIQYNWFDSNNNPGAASGNGIYTDEYVSGDPVANVLIDKNKFTDNEDAGITFSTSNPAKALSNVIISENEFTDNGRAVFLYNVVSSSFINNEINNSTMVGSGDVRIYGGVNNFTISNNIFSNGAPNGIRITDDGALGNTNITVSENSFTGYTTALNIVSGYTGILDANCNWWGTAVAAEIDPLAIGNVDFSPYLADGDDDDAVASGLQTTADCDGGTSLDPSINPTENYNFAKTPTVTVELHSQTLAENEWTIYKLDLIIGQEYTFSTGCPQGTATFDTYIEVFKADGITPIVAINDACAAGLSRVTWIATEAFAFVKVRGDEITDGRGTESTDFGDYTAGFSYTAPVTTCKVLPLYDFEVTPIADTWLNDGIRTFPAGECFVYKVNTAPGFEYTFKTGCDNNAAASFDTKLDVYKTNGTTIITSDDDGCDFYRSTVTWTATEAIAYIKVTGYLDTGGDFIMAYTCETPAGGGCKVAPDFDGLITNIGTSWQTAAQVTVDAEKCFVYMITLPSADTYTFKTGCASGFAGDNADASFDTFFELYGKTGAFINSNDDQCESGRSKLVYTSTLVPDTVYLKVRGYNIESNGTFSLAYVKGGGPTICKTITQAIAAPDSVTLNAPTDGWQLSASTRIDPGYCKFYKVPLTGGTTVIFKTGCGDGAAADFDTFLELWKGPAPGTYVTSNDDGCADGASKIIYTVPTLGGGDYYLKVRGYNDESTGLFTLAYTKGEEVGICKTIAQVVAGVPPDYGDPAPIEPLITWETTALPARSIAAGACHVYAFDLTAGNTYTFKTGCATSDPDFATATFDTYLALFNTAGTFIDSDDDGCEEGRSKLIYAPTVTGTYYLKVSGYSDLSTGTYRLAYRFGSSTNCTTPPFSDATLAQPATSWLTVSGDIASEACYVYRVPNIKTGVEYTFMTGCVEGTADFDTFLDLFNSAGTFIDSDDDGCGSGLDKLVWTATYGTGEDDDYAYVKVRGYSPNEYGDYTMAYKYVGSKEVLASIENQSAANSVKVYPNPADQLFTIDSKGPVSFTRITISELTGRMLHTWTMDTPATTYQINSSEFSQGIYVLSVETSEGWIRKKISIVR